MAHLCYLFALKQLADAPPSLQRQRQRQPVIRRMNVLGQQRLRLEPAIQFVADVCQVQLNGVDACSQGTEHAAAV